MLVTRAYKTELDLTNEQVTACKQHAGAARFAYNWALARRQEVYQATGKSVWAMELHRELNALKKTDLSWMYHVSKCAPQEALRNLDSAFSHFFRRCQLKQEGKWKGKLGYPKLKSKKKGLGQLPPDRLDCRLSRCYPVAPLRPLAAEGVRLPAHVGRQDPFSHRFGAGWALVCEPPGGARAAGA